MAYVECYVIETDVITKNIALCWSNMHEFSPILPSRNGEDILINTLDVIWWRRINYPQQVSSNCTPEALDLINRDWKEALFGLLYNEFCGVWINHPVATQLAENKLIQLHVASQIGLRVPATIVSQNPEKVKKNSALCSRTES
jgi:hypothetical protein